MSPDVNAKPARLAWVDAARGLGMIAIVVGHSYIPGVPDGPLMNFVYSFHVPLFVFVSGLLFSPSRLTLKTLAQSRWGRILFPYLVWATISLVIFTLLGSSVGDSLGRPAKENLGFTLLSVVYSNPSHGGMRWNTPLWFLTFLVAIQLISFGVWRIVELLKAPKWLPFALSIVLAAVGFAFLLGYNLPWSAERGVVLLPFFEAGILCKRFVGAVERLPRLFSGIAGALLLCVVWFLANQNSTVDYVNKQFGNIALWLIAALCGILAAVLIASAVRNTAWLRYVGIASLTILFVHKFPLVAEQLVLGRLVPVDMAVRYSEVGNLVMAAGALAASCVFHACAVRWVPIIVGIPRRSFSASDLRVAPAQRETSTP